MSKRRALAAMLLVLLSGALLATPPARGETPCDALVVDEAGVFQADLPRVEEAAQELVRAGGDVRVRTFPTLDSAGNLDQLQAQLEKECASWRAPDGTRKNNLIVLMIALQERTTGLYYGSQWESTLGKGWLRIQTEAINPRFRDGDFAGGFVNGLREIQRLATREVSATDGGPSLPWQVPVVIIAALAAGVGGFFAYREIAVWRRNAQRRRAAQQRARQAQQQAASLVNDLVEALGILEMKVGGMAGTASAEDVQRLTGRLEEARKQTDAGAEEYSKARSALGDPDQPRLSEASYQAMEEAYQKIVSALREAEAVEDDVDREVSRLQELAFRLPADLAAAKTNAEHAQSKLSAIQEQGFKTREAEGLLVRARESLAQAGTLCQERRLLAAGERLKEAEDLVAQAVQAAEDLPRQKQEAEAAIAALPQRSEKLRAAIAAGRESFERISSGYPDSAWESIFGNGTEAEKRLAWASESLDAARSAATTERQEWPQALGLLREANSWLDQAESFMRSIHALEAGLAAARRDAPQEVAAARGDIARAWEYINKYDEDIRESLEDNLREAEANLKAAQDDLEAARPDYLRALKLAQEANAAADRILEAARGEHEAAERLRVRAASALRDARAAVSKGKEFVEDHDAHVGQRAKSKLMEAQTQLGDGEAAVVLSVKVSCFQQAAAAAESAYAMACEDVRRAEEARSQRYVIIPGGAPRGPWGSRSGGRGSPAGWGSRGGGGSTGWGGGRGGGGSTKW